MKNQSLTTKLFITRTCCILALLGQQWSCEGNLTGGSTVIYAVAKIEFVDRSCTDWSECFGTVFKCNQNQRENLYLKIKFKSITGLVGLPYGKKTLNLTYDRTAPHFSVFQTQQKEGISLTKVVTDRVFYHRESTFPRQFKTIAELYGTVEEVSYEDRYYIRAVVQFVGCNQIQLNGFMRSGDELYQIRPTLTNSQKEYLSQSPLDHQNYHEILRYTSALDPNSHIFTPNSLAIQNSIKFDNNFLKLKSADENAYNTKKREIENRYCLVHMIVDKSLYQKMNSNTHKTVAYVQLAIMVANEIFKNSKWDKMEYGRIGFALKKIEIDLTFGNEYENFTRATFEKAFAKVDMETKELSCLVHLLTAKNVTSHNHNDEAVLHGINLVNGIFTRHNTGGTTVANCNSNPWAIECLVAFAHQLAHAMGATDDAKDEKHFSDAKLMDSHQEMIITKNLMLSNKTVREIVDKSLDPHEIKLFIPATDWSRCGNSIVEQGEQCDEGDIHQCCDSNCQFIKYAECSPINSLCCTEMCVMKQDHKNPCLPWNYFPDKSHFCDNKKAYCSPDTIVVDCFVDEYASEKHLGMLKYYLVFSVLLLLYLVFFSAKSRMTSFKSDEIRYSINNNNQSPGKFQDARIKSKKFLQMKLNVRNHLHSIDSNDIEQISNDDTSIAFKQNNKNENRSLQMPHNRIELEDQPDGHGLQISNIKNVIIEFAEPDFVREPKRKRVSMTNEAKFVIKRKTN